MYTNSFFFFGHDIQLFKLKHGGLTLRRTSYEIQSHGLQKWLQNTTKWSQYEALYAQLHVICNF